MKKINLLLLSMVIKENKKPIFWISFFFLMSIIFLLLTFWVSYYFTIISLPLSFLTVYFFLNLDDLKASYINIKSEYFYENGQLKFKIKKKNKNELQYVFYNKIGKIVGESINLYGKYSNECREYFDNGNIRMIQKDSEYKFYDENSTLRCVIYIKSEEVNIDEYSNNKDINCWFCWIWNCDSRVIYYPEGIWKEFNSDGKLNFELNFQNYNSKLNDNNFIERKLCDNHGNVIKTDKVYPKRIFMERFDQNFIFERIIDKRARYRIGHRNPGGWQYADFEISEILKIDDVLEILTLN